MKFRYNKDNLYYPVEVVPENCEEVLAYLLSEYSNEVLRSYIFHEVLNQTNKKDKR